MTTKHLKIETEYTIAERHKTRLYHNKTGYIHDCQEPQNDCVQCLRCDSAQCLRREVSRTGCWGQFLSSSIPLPLIPDTTLFLFF